MKTILKIFLLNIIIVVFDSCDNNDEPEKPSIIAVTDISLDKTSLTLLVGEEQRLFATILPYNATNKAVTWSSDNTAVVKQYAGY